VVDATSGIYMRWWMANHLHQILRYQSDSYLKLKQKIKKLGLSLLSDKFWGIVFEINKTKLLLIYVYCFLSIFTSFVISKTA